MQKYCVSFLILAAATAAAVKPDHTAEPFHYDSQMLSHVEKILVVDSIAVDKFEFFNNYRLQPSAGRILSGAEISELLGPTTLPEDFIGSPFTGFTNEFNDYMIWAHEDTTGYLRLAESVRLLDDSWSRPQFTPTVLNTAEDDDEPVVEANAAFPFMLDDGQTLYYASDNSESMGGYDIFIATKDPSDGEFLIPGNLGLPFNSPYDDYMMAIDRQTGVGWWATDRNQLEDRITIYIFAFTDDRINADPDDPNIMSLATLSGWEDFLTPDQQRQREALKSEIENIGATKTKQPEFTLLMPGGVVYHYFSDFKNSKAASRMQLYLGQKNSFDNKRRELDSMRARYAKGDLSIASKILTLEEQLRNEEQNLNTLLSEIYQAETNL